MSTAPHIATPEKSPDTVSRRYLLHNQLGKGGMGVVYRATDRLSGYTIALKQVLAQADTSLLNSLTEGIDLRLALSQEFAALASLRHPYVIGVLDYGFDVHHQPYFTMEYLANAANIFQAGHQLPLKDQINLIVQMLQALAYIHRRGIIHRDLKPGNILVSNGQVKVLDFGLSIAVEHSRDTKGTLGTLAYLAPEMLEDGAVSIASDLYTTGVIIYELLTSQHPFNTASITKLIEEIKRGVPDLSHPQLDTRIRPILRRLLMRSPTDRYSSAGEVLDALRESFGDLVPRESEGVRESFLQAARFVGREKPMADLSEGLIQTIGGMGSAWLIGGESGVGKSRLLSELRTLALVRGALVLRGQAISEGGSPFQVWRDVIRWLILLSDVSDGEASVLKSVIADIAILLGREVADAPEIDPQAAQSRLFAIVEDLFRRQPPLLVILEDVHWAGTESIALLNWLVRAELPIMLVVSYRDDEKPDLPVTLPRLKLLKLPRLSQDQTIALSEAMLGSVARSEQFAEVLQSETGGNPFFLVEVVRILAEEAGRLGKISTIEISRNLLSGGIKNVLDRRLTSLSAEDRPLLDIAAIAGRQLDLAVLQAANSDQSLDNWLNRCANLALIEQQDGRWRFVHDKLRERTLSELPQEKRRDYHRRVAGAIESVHSDQLPLQAATLAYHWRVAGDAAHELKYTLLAADQSFRSDANHEAVQYYERAVALDEQLHPGTPTLDQQIQRAVWLRSIGGAYYKLGRLPDSRKKYRASLMMLGSSEPATKGQRTTRLLSEVLRQISHRVRPNLMVRRHRRSDLIMEQARNFRELAETYFYNNEVLPAITATFCALNGAENVAPSAELAQTYADMTIMAGFMGLYGLAEFYCDRAIKTADSLHDEPSLMHTILRVSLYWLSVGEWNKARGSLERTANTYNGYGDKFGRGRSLGPLGALLRYQGNLQESVAINRDYLADARQRDDVFLQVWALSSQAVNYVRLGDTPAAYEYLEEAAGILERHPNRAAEIRVYGVLSSLYLRDGRIFEARQAASRAAVIIAESSFALYAVLEGYIGTADTFISLWEHSDNPADQAVFAHAAVEAVKALHKIAKRFPICKSSALHSQGRTVWLQGNHEKAHKLWQQGVAEAQKRAMPYEQALLHREIGLHLPADDAHRHEQLDCAKQLFEQLGTVYELP